MADQRRRRDWRDQDERYSDRDDPRRGAPRSAGRHHDHIEDPRGQRSWRQEMVDRPGSFLPNYDTDGDDDERAAGRADVHGAGWRGADAFDSTRRDRLQSRRPERSLWDRGVDEVSSWLGDERAAVRRQMDQFRGRGPKNYTRSDHRIHEDVCDRLTEAGAIDASDIDVEVKDGEVTLSGTVAARDQRRAAEDCAEAVAGVRHVQNNLRVAQPASPPAAGAGAAPQRPDTIGGVEFGSGPGSTR